MKKKKENNRRKTCCKTPSVPGEFSDFKIAKSSKNKKIIKYTS